MNPPEFSSRAAVNDFVKASKEVTGVAPVELGLVQLDSATRWLAKRWDIYYTPEQQAAILTVFVQLRLSK